jgi:hypothetical protein
MMESVNMVNAPVVARERNIEVAEVKHDRDSEYQTLVRLTVTTERRTITIAGTLFGGNKPRVVDIDGVPMEASLGRCMLYTRNLDMPGIIGGFGSIMGTAKINIANSGTRPDDQRRGARQGPPRPPRPRSHAADVPDSTLRRRGSHHRFIVVPARPWRQPGSSRHETALCRVGSRLARRRRDAWPG